MPPRAEYLGGRRILEEGTLEERVETWKGEGNERGATVDWRFTADILGVLQGDRIALRLCLVAYAIRLLAEPLRSKGVAE